MAKARRVIPDIDFNGKSTKKSLDGLTEEIEYDDVASGASDTLSIKVYNKDMKFLKGCAFFVSFPFLSSYSNTYREKASPRSSKLRKMP